MGRNIITSRWEDNYGEYYEEYPEVEELRTTDYKKQEKWGEENASAKMAYVDDMYYNMDGDSKEFQANLKRTKEHQKQDETNHLNQMQEYPFGMKGRVLLSPPEHHESRQSGHRPKNVFRINDLPKSVDCSDPKEFAWQVVVNICVPFKKQERR